MKILWVATSSDGMWRLEGKRLKSAYVTHRKDHDDDDDRKPKDEVKQNFQIDGFPSRYISGSSVVHRVFFYQVLPNQNISSAIRARQEGDRQSET